MAEGNYNIAKKNGETMLLHWVSRQVAQFYLDYYNNRYRSGSPYPNGRGYYPDFGFTVVSRALPACIQPACIDHGMVYIHHVDENARVSPVITWYNESYRLPMPSDHGVADYSCDYRMEGIDYDL